MKYLEKYISEEFNKATQASNKNVFGADRWVTHISWKLAHIRTLIIRMSDERYEDGTIIKVPVEHDPSPTRRALQEKELIVDLGDKELSEDASQASLSVNMKKILGF